MEKIKNINNDEIINYEISNMDNLKGTDGGVGGAGGGFGQDIEENKTMSWWYNLIGDNNAQWIRN